MKKHHYIIKLGESVAKFYFFFASFIFFIDISTSNAFANPIPTPWMDLNTPATWWFIFKLNAESYPGCTPIADEKERTCRFGGQLRKKGLYSQQYLVASNLAPSLHTGKSCLGMSEQDPLSATFAHIQDQSYNYVIWNDQFKDDPFIPGCHKICFPPWGHSKGILAWNDAGQGVVIQVTTPAWPAAVNKTYPRKTDGNTLGCIQSTNNLRLSQHFFALKLSKNDTAIVLKGLLNAGVATDPHNPQIVHNGGPKDIQTLVNQLGRPSTSREIIHERLSSGIQLIVKPARLHVPPWQMVSALLDGVGLRVATFWRDSHIPSTKPHTRIACWNHQLPQPGPVEIATTGQWQGHSFNLWISPTTGFDTNHAKIAVSIDNTKFYTVFGDLNQKGAIFDKPYCSKGQNGRGGLFFVADDEILWNSVTQLLRGKTLSTNIQTARKQYSTLQRKHAPWYLH